MTTETETMELVKLDVMNKARIRAEIRADLIANWTEDQLDLLASDEIAFRLTEAIMAGKIRNVKVIF